MKEEVKKEFKITFDEVFAKLSTEKSLKDAETLNILTCVAKKHIRKNLAKVLFKQKFGVAAKDVRSSAMKQIVKIRTKTKRDEKVRILKKFYFAMPEGVKVPE